MYSDDILGAFGIAASRRTDQDELVRMEAMRVYEMTP